MADKEVSSAKEEHELGAAEPASPIRSSAVIAEGGYVMPGPALSRLATSPKSSSSASPKRPSSAKASASGASMPSLPPVPLVITPPNAKQDSESGVRRRHLGDKHSMNSPQSAEEDEVDKTAGFGDLSLEDVTLEDENIREGPQDGDAGMDPTAPSSSRRNKIPLQYYVLPVMFMEFLAIALTRAVLPSMILRTFRDSVYIVMGCAEAVRGLLAFVSCPLFGKISDSMGRKACLFVTVLGTCAPVCSLALMPAAPISTSAAATSASSLASIGRSNKRMWIFVYLLSLSGLFSSTFTLVFAYISDVVPHTRAHERVSSYGLALATFGLSFTIGPMAGGYLSRVDDVDYADGAEEGGPAPHLPFVPEGASGEEGVEEFTDASLYSIASNPRDDAGGMVADDAAATTTTDRSFVEAATLDGSEVDGGGYEVRPGATAGAASETTTSNGGTTSQQQQQQTQKQQQQQFESSTTMEDEYISEEDIYPAVHPKGQQRVFFMSLILTILDLLYIYFVLPESLPKAKQKRRFTLSQVEQRVPVGQLEAAGADDDQSSVLSSARSIQESIQLRMEEWKQGILPQSWTPLDALRVFSGDPLLAEVGRIAFLYYTGLWAVISTLVIYAAKRFHYGPERLGELMSAFGLCTMLAEAVLLRIVVPIAGEKRTMKIGLAAFALQCVVLGLATDGWQLFVCVALSTFSNLVYPSLTALVSGTVAPDAVGEALGAVNGVKALTEGVGPLFFGGLMTISEKSALPGWPYLIAASFAILAYQRTRHLPDEDDDDSPYINEKYSGAKSKAHREGRVHVAMRWLGGATSGRSKPGDAARAIMHGKRSAYGDDDDDEGEQEIRGLLSNVDEEEEEEDFEQEEGRGRFIMAGEEAKEGAAGPNGGESGTGAGGNRIQRLQEMSFYSASL